MHKGCREPKKSYSYSSTGYYLRNYKLSAETLEVMKSMQQNTCRICGSKPKKLFIDHNHSTGRVRALLCPSCNLGLGLFKDSPELLTSAANYVRVYE